MELRGVEAEDADAGNSGEAGEQATSTTTAAAMVVRSSGESERKNDLMDLPRGSGDSKQNAHENGRRRSNISVAITPRMRAGEDVGEGPSRRPPQVDKDVVPDAIGRETCPICIVDFEEGDDLRLLPCEGKHRFHQQCVDPWLLELSSSCPICRQGVFSIFVRYTRPIGMRLVPFSCMSLQISWHWRQCCQGSQTMVDIGTHRTTVG
jgi:hypothetical protein